MTQEELIEKCAKALYLRRHTLADQKWDDIHTQHREPYRKDVQAVISALEVSDFCAVPYLPTPAMIGAAWKHISSEKHLAGIARLGPVYGVTDIYEQMIKVGKIEITTTPAPTKP